MPWLINPTQLDNFRRNQKNLIILDASWHMPQENRNAKEEFAQEHIWGAQFFDITEFNDPNFPHENRVLLDEKMVSEKLGLCGIRNDYKIIFYDNSALHSAARAVWMMKLFGHSSQQLYILNGGFNAWKKNGGKIEKGNPSVSQKSYTATLALEYLATLQQMKINCENPYAEVLDARHPVRFTGGPEPRPGMRSGHIPGSFCFPYFTMFDKDGCYLPIEKISQKLTDIGIDLNLPIITTCGTAITAPIINFVLDLMNHQNHQVYNGSWAEWGNENLLPGESSLRERPVETF